MADVRRKRESKRIVAVKLDRLVRNTRDFLAAVDRLWRYDCDLVLLAESFDTSTSTASLR